MGLFGNQEQINLSEPGEVPVAEHVAAAIPDAGEYFLDWIGDVCNEQMYARLKAEVDSRRASNGWLVANNFADVPGPGRKQTPMTYLSSFVGGRDAISLVVWGTYGTRGKDHAALAGTLHRLVNTQGHGAAATWAITARPEAPHLRLGLLSEALQQSWHESHDYLRNKDILKAFRNWNK